MAWVNLSGESFCDVSQLKLRNESFKHYYDSLRGKDIEVLPDEKIREYIKIYQTSENEEERNNALQTIMLHNQGMILSLVMKYGNADNCADLVGDANLALQKAVTMFNLEDKRCKFYGYALTAMFRSINKINDKYSNQMYHLRSEHDLKLIKRFIREFTQENMREPTEDEIKDFIQENDEVGCSYENLRNQQMLSIDGYVQDSDEEGDYNKLISITSQTEYSNTVMSNEYSEKVSNSIPLILDELNKWANTGKTERIKNNRKRNIEIFCKYFGVNGYTQKVTEDLCRDYNITGTTVFNVVKECICEVRKSAKNNRELVEELGLSKSDLEYDRFKFFNSNRLNF